MSRSSHHPFILSLIVGVHFAAVMFLLPLLPGLGAGSPWLETAFALSHIAALPLMGRLADRRGVRFTLALSLLGQLLAFGLLFASRSPEILLVARLLSGSSSAVLPACFAAVRRGAKNERSLSRGIAIVMLGITAGGGLGAVVSGVFSQRPDVAAGIIIAGVLLAFASVQMLKDDPAEGAKPRSSSAWHRDLKEVLLSRPLRSMAFVFLATSSGFHLYRTLLPYRFEEPWQAGTALAFLAAAIGLSQLVFVLRPVAADRALRGYLATLCSALAGFLLGIPPSILPALLLSLLVLGGSIGAADVLGGAALARFTKYGNAGSAAGMVFGIGALGKVAGPSLATLFTKELSLGFTLAALLGFTGLLILLRLTRLRLAKQK